MEDEETLKAATNVSKSSNTVKNIVNLLFPDSVMATSIIVSSIFLSGYHLLRMEESSVSPCADLI